MPQNGLKRSKLRVAKKGALRSRRAWNRLPVLRSGEETEHRQNRRLCMRHTIQTAPKDGNAIILEDDASGTYDVAHWSPEAGEGVGKNGEPSKITPTHWHPMSRDKSLLSLLQEVE